MPSASSAPGADRTIRGAGERALTKGASTTLRHRCFAVVVRAATMRRCPLCTRRRPCASPRSSEWTMVCMWPHSNRTLSVRRGAIVPRSSAEGPTASYTPAKVPANFVSLSLFFVHAVGTILLCVLRTETGPRPHGRHKASPRAHVDQRGDELLGKLSMAHGRMVAQSQPTGPCGSVRQQDLCLWRRVLADLHAADSFDVCTSFASSRACAPREPRPRFHDASQRAGCRDVFRPTRAECRATSSREPASRALSLFTGQVPCFHHARQRAAVHLLSCASQSAAPLSSGPMCRAPPPLYS